MAKTTKKSAKKHAAKTAKSKSSKEKKKSTAAKSQAKTVKKSSPKSKTVKTKSSVKPKATAAKKKETKKTTKSTTTRNKTEQKSTMAKRTTKKSEEKKQEHKPEINAAEARAKALEKIKGYSKKDLEHFKNIILEKRDEIIEQLQNLREQMLDPTTGEYINENSPYSLHMAEQGTDAMEREKTFLYAQRENKFLGYLEDALKRIENGIYGICIECIDEPQHLCETCPLVPKARLEAVPHSQLCLPIKQRQEKR